MTSKYLNSVSLLRFLEVIWKVADLLPNYLLETTPANGLSFIFNPVISKKIRPPKFYPKLKNYEKRQPATTHRSTP